MADWPTVLKWLVHEVLKQTRTISRAAVQRPFQQSSAQWLQIIIAVCFRLGWVFELAAGERNVKTEVTKALALLGFEHLQVLTLEQVAEVLAKLLTNLGRRQNESSESCPSGLLRDAEFQILTGLARKIEVRNAAARPSPESTPAATPPHALVVASRDRDTPTSASPQLAQQLLPMEGFRRRLSFSDFSAASSRSARSSQSGCLVSAPPSEASSPVGSQHSLVSVSAGSSAYPALPPNLDDMDRKELKRTLLENHSAWLLTANQIAIDAKVSAEQLVKKNRQRVKKTAMKRTTYWKTKARKQKTEFEQKYNTLVYETDVYINSKRRKKNAHFKKMSAFGGQGLEKQKVTDF